MLVKQCQSLPVHFLGDLVFLTYVVKNFHSINNDEERALNIYGKITFRELNCFLSWLKICLTLSSRKSAEFSLIDGRILLLSAGAKNAAQRAVILFL